MTGKETDAYDALVDEVIEAYRKLLNQGMALDVCRVQGKMRSMILRDARFIKETRAIRAEKYMRELEEIEEIYSAASRLGDDSGGYDSSGRDGPSRGRSSDKDALSMQLKAAAMRRELTALTADDTGDNEESAVNFFFTALTAGEMEAMKQVEVHRGTSGDDDALGSIDTDDSHDVAAQAKKRKRMTSRGGSEDGEDAPSDGGDPFEVMPDGSLRARG